MYMLMMIQIRVVYGDVGGHDDGRAFVDFSYPVLPLVKTKQLGGKALAQLERKEYYRDRGRIRSRDNVRILERRAKSEDERL